MKENNYIYIIKEDEALAAQILKLQKVNRNLSAAVFLTGIVTLCVADVIVKNIAILHKNVEMIQQELENVKDKG